MHELTYTYIHTYIYIHTYTHTYIHAYTHTHTHTHTHAYIVHYCNTVVRNLTAAADLDLSERAGQIW